MFLVLLRDTNSHFYATEVIIRNQDIVVAPNLLTDSIICELRAALKRHAGVVTV